MKPDLPKTVLRSDYAPPVFEVERVEMGFDLDRDETRVATRLHLVRKGTGPLVLDGDSLTMLSIALDGTPLDENRYRLVEDGHQQTLTIDALPDRAVLDIGVRIAPAANTSLMGLYASSDNLVTQCEAEGFRKIAFFPDRPDVMSRFTVVLRADRRRFPVLLSNGNLIDAGPLPDGRHYARWDDPFRKPSYLFALVAGTFEHIERRVRTRSGREVRLQVYTEPRDIGKAGHALASLERAMRWDEERFGLELDLDRFMIVAVGDFNMGAMENKGLNVFNTKYVLVDERTETDTDFANVEAVVGHEYFHNWTGNRVTCRDWFQLTLKEGLTVFRDQEFSADMATAAAMEGDGARGVDLIGIRAALRIANVRHLRASQFPEDAGPMAHPIRPESYQEIGNFYTSTVYQKGSEVIRMQHTLLGRDGFRAGMDEYFRRHDGTAVTCDDFVSALSFASGRDLEAFKRWYSQAGTPRVVARSAYDADAQRFVLTLRQICPRVGVEKLDARRKAPFHIPFAVGLIGRDGRPVPLVVDRTGIEAERAEPPEFAEPADTMVLDLVDDEQSFTFVDVPDEPVPSLLRGFSAPVIVEYPYDDEDLALLSAHDADPFNRWEAGQRLATRELLRLVADAEAGRPLVLRDTLLSVFRATLSDAALDPGLKEAALMLPSEGVIGEQLTTYDPSSVRKVRLFAIDALASGLVDEWHRAYVEHDTPGPYSTGWRDCARRALKNCALAYLARLDDRRSQTMLDAQWSQATNMTDRLAALQAIVHAPDHVIGARHGERRTRAIDAFYRRFRREPLVIDKWLRVQSTSLERVEETLASVDALTRHAAYAASNPNKVSALLGGFFHSNGAAFHRADGRGHAFWAAQVVHVDAINPSVAGRLARALERWKKLTPPLQESARRALEIVRASDGLSRDVCEIVDKALSV